MMAATAQVTNIPPGLLEALCFVESSHNPQAKHQRDGGSPSHGLCQVKEKTARQFYPAVRADDLYDPAINVRVAATYLSWQYKRYRSWPRAVVAYNRGNAKGLQSSEYQRKVFKLWEGYVGQKTKKLRQISSKP